MSKPISILILLIAIHLIALSQEVLRKATLDEVISRWDKRDGGQVVDIGPELADRFVENDSLFFRAMLKHPTTFQSWINELQYSTFTIYNFTTAEDSIRLRTQLTRLREQMIIAAEKYRSTPPYSTIAETLISELNKIYIRFID